LPATELSGVTRKKITGTANTGVPSKRDEEDANGMWNGWNENGVFPILSRLKSPRDFGGLIQWVSGTNL